uniref:dual specificity protein phosphatase 19 isoform X1 n=1 Tax=Halichoerus grypus TaxID=9711 RepID=UPI001659DE1C|nr:dual specificity protein phosphatase 19 isoform X1 [Halichoerus grypus]
MHSLNQEIKAFSRNNLRKQCTRVTTLTGKKIIETWKDARIHVVEEVEPSSGGSCGYVQDLSLDLHVGVIKPWLLLGSQDAAHDLDTLKKYKVTHILNVAYGVENAFLSDFIYKSISILDLPETNILSYFPECFEFIEQAKMKRPSQGKSQAFSVGQQNSSGLRGAVGQEVEAEVEKLRAHEVMAPRESEEDGVVLVHCNAGVSRAAAVVVGFLMNSEEISFTSAFSLVKNARPSICPNAGFMEQLRTYQEGKESNKCDNIQELERGDSS